MDTARSETTFVGIQAIFTSPEYSDLTAICGSNKYLLHRAIICPRSAFFEEACARDSKDTHNTTVTLVDDDPLAVNRMLIYLYTNDYPEGCIPPDQRPFTATEPSVPPNSRASDSSEVIELEPCSTHDKLLNNFLVYATADKYDVARLRLDAQRRFSSLLQDSWPQLQIGSVISAISDMKLSRGQGLREFFTVVCAKHIDEIMDNPPIVTSIKKDMELSFAIFRKAHQFDRQALEQSLADRAYIEANLTKSISALQKTVELEQEAIAEKCVAVEAQKVVFDQKVSAIAEKNRLIQERDDALNQKASAVEAKDLALSLQAFVLKEKEKIGEERDTALSQKHHATKEKDRVVQERDAALSHNTAAINMSDLALNQKAFAMKEKNEAIKARDAALSNSAAVMKEKNLALNQKAFAIKQRNEVIKERDAALSRESNLLARLDHFLKQLGCWNECRNCGTQFCSYMERFGDDDELSLQLRCLLCKCRHDLGAGRD